MKRRNFSGLALVGILATMISFNHSATAQPGWQLVEPSFAPAGGILGSVMNPAAFGLTMIPVSNGVPVQAMGPLGRGAVPGPHYQPFQVRPNVLPSAVPMHLGGPVVDPVGRAYCKGFARASDGSLVATSGGGYQSMIIGEDCDALIQRTLDAGHGVIFSASVLFNGSSDTITLTARRALKMTADAIRATGGIYEVAGYASREGDRIANDYLSWRRAKAASYFLIHHGVATDHINIVGKGETTIFGPALAVNRRVVVRKKA